MFNAIKFFLILMMVATSPLSVADSCMESCKNEAYQYIDQQVPAENSNVIYMCSTNCTLGEYSCFSEVSIAEIAQTLKGKPDNYTGELCKSLREVKRENKAQKRAADKEKFKERLRQLDRKHQERMEAIRSQQNQPAPQARTQTSQNNSPSDSTNEQNGSNSSSSSSASRGGIGNDAKNCVQVTRSDKGHPGFRNVCNINITVKYCVVDHDCRGYPGFSRTSNLSPSGKTNAYADPHQDVRYGACEAGQFLDDSANDGNYVCKIR